MADPLTGNPTGRSQVRLPPNVWVRSALFVFAVVLSFVGPRWLTVLAWTLVVLNLVWMTFTKRAGVLIDGLRTTGVLPQWITLRGFRIFVAVDLAIVAVFVVSALGRS